jgi:hypothetical protein
MSRSPGGLTDGSSRKRIWVYERDSYRLFTQLTVASLQVVTMLPLQIETSTREPNNMTDPLKTVQQATARRAESDASWRAAIRQAHAEGASLRQIAAAAGVSHVRILQIARGR